MKEQLSLAENRCLRDIHAYLTLWLKAWRLTTLLGSIGRNAQSAPAPWVANASRSSQRMTTGYNAVETIAIALAKGGSMRHYFRSIANAFAICALAACQHPTPNPSIGVGNPYPLNSYVCEGTRLAVRLMGESASVSVDGAAAVDLPAIGESGTIFSNGRQTLSIEQGRMSWAMGRAMPVACTGG